MKRVAVTGLGAICAIGADVASVQDAMLAGRCGLGPPEDLPTERLTTRVLGQVRGFDPLAHFDAKRLVMLDRYAMLALVAAREAVRNSGFVPDDPRRVGVVLGACMGQGTLDDAYSKFYGERSDRVHPFTVPRVMPNAAASQVSMEMGLRGPVFAAASACASSNHAIGQAADLIRTGRADAVITGGADASLCVGFIRSWEAIRVLSPDGCRPFSRDRNGLVLGEGAGVLVLEEWERARARGAPVLAELAGWGMSADGADLTAPDMGGAAAAMRDALRDAGLDREDVGYVNAHGTGTRLNDRTESAALHAVFGERPPPVSSTKSMIGHCLNAGGALEAVATVLALRDRVLPPSAGYNEPDPDCALDVVTEARPGRVRAALSNAFAFGGLNAVLAFRPAE